MWTAGKPLHLFITEGKMRISCLWVQLSSQHHKTADTGLVFSHYMCLCLHHSHRISSMLINSHGFLRSSPACWRSRFPIMFPLGCQRAMTSLWRPFPENGFHRILHTKESTLICVCVLSVLCVSPCALRKYRVSSQLVFLGSHTVVVKSVGLSVRDREGWAC